jgi:hypothetical protein
MPCHPGLDPHGTSLSVVTSPFRQQRGVFWQCFVACGERCVRRAGRRHRPPAAASLRSARLAGALRNSLCATRAAQTAAVRMMTNALRAAHKPCAAPAVPPRPARRTHRSPRDGGCLWRRRKTATGTAPPTALREVHARRDRAARDSQFSAPQALLLKRLRSKKKLKLVPWGLDPGSMPARRSAASTPPWIAGQARNDR